MGRYFIYEGNLEKLEKKIGFIERKCSKYGLHFTYEKVGEEIRVQKDKNDEDIEVKFIEIEVDGIMKHNNWEFIAKVDHYSEGNIVRQFNTDIEVPERYRHTEPICEHCQTSRRRKFTYLVHNTETDEWKQVGASCLKEFTFGLDAEDVARYISLFDYIIEGGEGCYTGITWERHYSLEQYLCYVKETVEKLGYVSNSDAYYDYGKQSTSSEAFDFYLYNTSSYFKATNKHIGERMEEINFGDAERDENLEYVKSAIEWIRSEQVKESDGYMFNLRIACLDDYFPGRNMGLVASLMPTYYRHLKKIAYEEKKKKEIQTSKSKFVGNVKDRITFHAVSIECVYSSDSLYGMNYLYKITDSDENVYMWSTGKVLDTDKEVDITGTIKNHQEYRGIKQTVLTRCKIA